MFLPGSARRRKGRVHYARGMRRVADLEGLTSRRVGSARRVQGGVELRFAGCARVTRFDVDGEGWKAILDEEIVAQLEMLFRHRSQLDLCVYAKVWALNCRAGRPGGDSRCTDYIHRYQHLTMGKETKAIQKFKRIRFSYSFFFLFFLKILLFYFFIFLLGFIPFFVSF